MVKSKIYQQRSLGGATIINHSQIKSWLLDFKWAKSRENVSSEIFDQVWLKPVCSATATS